MGCSGEGSIKTKDLEERINAEDIKVNVRNNDGNIQGVTKKTTISQDAEYIIGKYASEMPNKCKEQINKGEDEYKKITEEYNNQKNDNNKINNFFINKIDNISVASEDKSILEHINEIKSSNSDKELNEFKKKIENGELKSSKSLSPEEELNILVKELELEKNNKEISINVSEISYVNEEYDEDRKEIVCDKKIKNSINSKNIEKASYDLDEFINDLRLLKNESNSFRSRK